MMISNARATNKSDDLCIPKCSIYYPVAVLRAVVSCFTKPMQLGVASVPGIIKGGTYLYRQIWSVHDAH